MSDEEIILWSELRLLRKQGLHFRRQVPRGPYVLDFACLKSRIAVEVDGEQHFHGNRPIKDALRDKYFAKLGFVTLRYTTTDIRKSLNSVVEDIFCRTAERVFPPLQGRVARRAGWGEIMLQIAIAPETPLQDDVRVMVAELNAYLMPLTPREFQFQLTAEQMAEPTVTVLVARDGGGRSVGMASLKEHGDGLGEVKRIYTLPEVRGQRIGSQLLQRVEDFARQKGLTRLVLETGEAPGFEPAWRVYERGGFQVCGAVLDYPDSGYSRFYEKKLV
jgi:putative acetyltransferase